MVTRFDDWEGDFLEHHGIKGQKWGIRRYQNPDGTLTELGRKRVAQSGSYMEIDVRRAAKRFGRIRDDNRRAVYQSYNKAYWKNHGEMYDNPHKTSDAYKQLHDRFKDKWTSATLKDLGFKNTSAAKKQVRAILKDISSDWDDPDPSWSKRQEADKRRQEMMHPKRTKAKKTAKKVVDAIKTVKQITE